MVDMENTTKYMTVKQLAELCKCSRQNILQYVKTKKIRPTMRLADTYFFSKKVADKFKARYFPEEVIVQ